MTLEEANKIVRVWGTYLEYVHEKLNFVFGSSVPESFLPFSKDVLEEAINIVTEHYYNLDDQKAVKDLQGSVGYLFKYKDDEKAVLQTAKMFNNKKWRESILPTFKDFQNKWIETQKI